jgi:hypothetical protein
MANSLSYQELEFIISKTPYSNKKFPVFVETGSAAGDTISQMAGHLDEIHSIELSTVFYEHCKKRFAEDKTINLYQGDSALLLKPILEKISNNIVYFLDGHWSSGMTARGSVDVPLIEELKLINQNKFESIIVIDDYRLFGCGPNNSENKHCNEDWSQITVESILSCVNNRLGFWGVHNDRMVLGINNGN